jgi:hypothetical protein
MLINKTFQDITLSKPMNVIMVGNTRVFYFKEKVLKLMIENFFQI